MTVFIISIQYIKNAIINCMIVLYIYSAGCIVIYNYTIACMQAVPVNKLDIIYITNNYRYALLITIKHTVYIYSCCLSWS